MYFRLNNTSDTLPCVRLLIGVEHRASAYRNAAYRSKNCPVKSRKTKIFGNKQHRGLNDRKIRVLFFKFRRKKKVIKIKMAGKGNWNSASFWTVKIHTICNLLQ